MLRALDQVRRMRGGAQSHLMRCSDGRYYVVKFQNNPQHLRILANELLGTKLAAWLGLPTMPVAVVDVTEKVIRATPELCMEMPRSRLPCQAGLQFASRFPGDPRRMTLHDFLPDELLRAVANLRDFAGMLVFDKWTCNTNGRQTIFYARRSPPSRTVPLEDNVSPGDPARHGFLYETRMIDQGFCFNAGEWTFPDAPLRGLYTRNCAYHGVTGMESFTPWLSRLGEELSEEVLDALGREIPPEWYADDHDALRRLLEQLYRRRSRVAELIWESKKSLRQPFPNWI